MTKTSFDLLGRGPSPHEEIVVPGTCFSSVQMARVEVKLFSGKNFLSKEVTVIGICISNMRMADLILVTAIVHIRYRSDDEERSQFEACKSTQGEQSVRKHKA